VTSVSLVPSANPLAVGENVTITLNPQMNITVGSWLLGGNILVTFYPGGFKVNDGYTGRISFNTSTSQITLYSVQ
ncbi:carcinoembryonic antigen-related cell adhesion molecule 5-like, partial [Clarias magur]